MTSTSAVPAYLMPGISIAQPAHLEGDASLATEILPGPPPLLFSQQSTHKKDPKKPAVPLSYLPASDPGSTYSGFGMASAMGNLEAEGPRRKRARLDRSSITGRAQRASARNLNSLPVASDPLIPNDTAGSSSMPLVPDLDLLLDSDPPTLSRAGSASHLDESNPISKTRSTRKDKGKGKDLGVKSIEDPNMTSPGPGLAPINEDHCSSCRFMGALVYCDGCPRAYHLWCLDPPMEAIEDATWFCPSCTMQKDPPPKPPASFLAPLIQQAQTSLPTEYQLPDDIRSFFKDVSTGPRGGYVDSSEIKQPRLNRHGQLEDRDPYRLKDRNGAAVLCFKCETTALPSSIAAVAPATKRARMTSPHSDKWKSIISCDYCGLHWHLDCLDPPLSTMPSFGKKWMCPNHVDHILQPKRRVPKQNSTPIDVVKPGQFNNGNIEVIHPETNSTNQNKVAVDEVLINGRRYRIPERVIMLDFWSKVGRRISPEETEVDIPSNVSSPLTSLSSLEDEEPFRQDLLDHNTDEVKIAQLLCNMQDAMKKKSASNHMRNGFSKRLADKAMQTETESQPKRSNGRGIDFPSVSTSAKRGRPVKQKNGPDSAYVPPPAPQKSQDNGRTERRSTRKPKPVFDAVFSFSSAESVTPHTQKGGRKRARANDTNATSSVFIKREEKTDGELLNPLHPIHDQKKDTKDIPRRKRAITGPSAPVSVPSTSSGQAPQTPSLKIRLPRLSGVSILPQNPHNGSPLPLTSKGDDFRLRRSSRRRTQSTATPRMASPTSSKLSS